MRNLIRAILFTAIATSPAQAQDTLRLTPRAIGAPNVGYKKITPLGQSPDARFTLYRTERRGYIYWLPDTSNVEVYDRQTGKSWTLIANAVAAHWSPTGDAVAFTRAEEEGRRMYVWVVSMDPRTGKAQGTPKRIGRSPTWQQMEGRPAISPDGKTVAYPTLTATTRGVPGDTCRIVTVPIGGGAERVIVPNGPRRSDVAWSPDGKSIYYAQPKAGTGGPLVRVSLADMKQQVIVTGVSGFLGFSGDHRYLAYDTPGGALHVADADGQHARPMAPPPGFDGLGDQWWDSRWSPVGARLLSAQDYIPTELDVIKIADGSIQKVPAFDGPTWTADWAPDGSWFEYWDRSEDHPYYYNVRTQRNVTMPPGFPEWISWSPDGRRATFWFDHDTVSSGPPTKSVAVNGDFKGAKEFKVGIRGGQNAGWSPDSKQLLYVGGSPRELRVLNTITGVDSHVANLPAGAGQIQWEAGSRAVHYVATTNGKTVLQQIHLGAEPTTRTFPLWDSENPAVLRPLNDTAAMVISRKGVSILSLNTGTMKLVIPHEFDKTQFPGDFSKAFSATPDKQHITFILFDPTAGKRMERSSLRIYSLNGTLEHTFPVSEDYGDIYNHDWLPNGQEFVALAEYATRHNKLRPFNGTDAMSRDALLISTTGAPARVLTSKLKFYSLDDWWLSPTGEYLAVSIHLPMTKPTELVEFDVGAALARTASSSKK